MTNAGVRQPAKKRAVSEIEVGQRKLPPKDSLSRRNSALNICVQAGSRLTLWNSNYVISWSEKDPLQSRCRGGIFGRKNAGSGSGGLLEELKRKHDAVHRSSHHHTNRGHVWMDSLLLTDL